MAQAYTERNSGQACLRVAEGLSMVFDFATGQAGWWGLAAFAFCLMRGCVFTSSIKSSIIYFILNYL
jgi:hypothetical protein